MIRLCSWTVLIVLVALSACTDKPRVEMVKVNHIASVSASSQHPSFPPSLILDGGPKAENAWHSMTRPSFPQWIQIRFPAPVRLQRFAIQAQFNAPGTSTDNVRRAPRKLELLASEDPQFNVYENLGSFDCTYSGPGGWCTHSIDISSNPHTYFRFVILANGGDPDFVTIQEMNFFSEE
jgi:hypothetical protein